MAENMRLMILRSTTHQHLQWRAVGVSDCARGGRGVVVVVWWCTRQHTWRASSRAPERCYEDAGLDHDAAPTMLMAVRCGGGWLGGVQPSKEQGKTGALVQAVLAGTLW